MPNAPIDVTNVAVTTDQGFLEDPSFITADTPPGLPTGIPNFPGYIDRQNSFASFSGDYLVSTTGYGKHLPIPYGTRRYTGHLILAERSINSIYIAWAVCEGPVVAVNNILFDGKPIGSLPFVNDLVSYTGTDAQPVDVLLGSNVTGWESSLPGTVYVRVRISLEDLVGSSVPSMTCEIDGREIFDPRDLSTSLSTNPVLCLRDYLTDDEVGLGSEDADIDDVSLGIVADWSDEIVGGEERWSLNLPAVGNTSDAIVREIINHFFGFLSWFNGTFYVEARRPKATADLSLTQLDHVNGVGWKRTPHSGRPNKVQLAFTDATDWAVQSRTSETGTLNPRDVRRIDTRLAGCTSSGMAQRWADQYRLSLNLENIHTNVAVTGAGLALLPGDRVDLTSDTGLTAQPFRVITITSRYDGVHVLSLEEYDPAAQSDVISAADPVVTRQLGATLPNPDTSAIGLDICHIEQGNWDAVAEFDADDLTTGDWTLDAGTRTYDGVNDWTEFGIQPAIGGLATLRATFDPGTSSDVFLTVLVKFGIIGIGAFPAFRMIYKVDGVEQSATVARDDFTGAEFNRISIRTPVVAGTTHEIVIEADGIAGETGRLFFRRARAIGLQDNPGLCVAEQWTWDQLADPSLASGYVLRVWDSTDVPRLWGQIDTGATGLTWGGTKESTVSPWIGNVHHYEFSAIASNGSGAIKLTNDTETFQAISSECDGKTLLDDEFLSEAEQTSSLVQPAFTTALSDTWTAPAAGSYVLEWSWEFCGDDGGNEPACSLIKWNGVEEGYYYYGAGTGGTVSDRWGPGAGRSAVFTATMDQAFSLTVQFAKAKTGSYDASIRRIRVHVWRVA